MHGIIAFLENNLVSVLSITVLTGATVTTSVMGMTRVAGDFRRSKLAVPNEKTVSSSSSSVSFISTAAVTPTGSETVRLVDNESSSQASSSSNSINSEYQISSEGTTSSNSRHTGRGNGKQSVRTVRNEDQAEEDRIHAEQ